VSEIKIYSVYEDEFNDRLAKANRRALKNGLGTISTEISRERNKDGRLVSIIAIEYSLPHFDGWSLNSIVDFVGDESLTRTVPGKSLPSGFDNVDATKCDHCGIRHQRNRLFVIEHNDGKIMQVGLNCMEVFLGKEAASLISDSWLIDFNCDIAEMEADGDGWGCFKSPLDLVDYLSAVKLAIAAYGWMPKGKAAELGKKATAYVAYSMKDRKERSAAIALANANPHKKEYTIADALAWTKEQSGSDYLENIASIARLEIVPRKYDGYAASILAAYERHLEQEITKANQSESCTPAPSGRVAVKGTIASIKEKWGDYGMQLKMTLIADSGWKLYATLPKSISSEARAGDKIELTVTVKPSHKDAYFAFGSRPTKCRII